MKDLIIHVGVSGFPKGNATAQRIKMTFWALKEAGFKVIIFNKESVNKNNPNTHVISWFEGLPIIQTSCILNRPSNFIIRNINKISGLLGELKAIFRLRHKIEAAIVYTPSFFELVYYYLLSKIFKFSVILSYVELRSSISTRQTAMFRFNDYLFDQYCSYFCDSIIAISDFLINNVRNQNSKLPILKIPAITNFKEFDDILRTIEKYNYLMYCGTIQYTDVILFLLDLFSELKNQISYPGKLVLIISGDSPTNYTTIKNRIKETGLQDHIIFFSNIPYNQLLSLYKGADALLIPLRHSTQDIARFPHKISEYSASGRPIISTRVGEVSIYFENTKSAFLAEEYSVESYLAVLQNLNDKEHLTTVGNEGKKIGETHFHYSNYTEKLKSFIQLSSM
ncbi:glycosyltransferase [Dyadobacter subterraneus]|uniref:Glycosyltransferase n=1 Tax=Dyadobacter subterraneus TaxID=2773304 RepID=A0ABR9WM74_9BACT|nr:glycosyltransferase [Dyadobacter subterraneus]MBE9466620.1 glycosyltransferase [Dyadobacter subterraneus]